MLERIAWYSGKLLSRARSHLPPGNSMEPGAIAFTRMRFGAKIRASDDV